MANPRHLISAWLHRHDWIFEALQSAVAQAASRSGDLARVLDGTTVGDPEVAARSVQEAADHLGSIVKQAQALPPVPDADTNRFFRNGLARWEEAAESLAEASSAWDGRRAMHASRGLAAGTDEFLRSAAALRRATGQAPDPLNPFS